MISFYQTGIRIFYFGIFIASLFNRKAILWIKGRRNVFEKLKTFNEQRATNNEQRIWVHCSSLGEFEQARPLIEKFKSQNTKIVITFFSPSGYEIRKNHESVDLVCYLPLDTKTNAKKFISALNPSKVFFVKYDFWYNFLNELHERKIPSYLVSANFRGEQFKGVYGIYLKKVLKFFSKIFVQNESSEKILNANNFSNIIVAGDLRFDRVTQTVSSPKKISIAKAFKGKSKLIVCGNTWS